MKSIWPQKKYVGGEFLGEKYMGEFLGEKYMAAKKIVGGEFLGEKYMAAKKNCGWRGSG